MLGDVEHHAVRAVEFGLVKAGMTRRRRVPEAVAAQRFDMSPRAGEVVDQDAEMMQADIVWAFAELIVVAEIEDRDVQRAVAKIDAVDLTGLRIGWTCPPDLFHLEGGFVEICDLFG